MVFHLRTLILWLCLPALVLACADRQLVEQGGTDRLLEKTIRTQSSTAPKPAGPRSPELAGQPRDQTPQRTLLQQGTGEFFNRSQPPSASPPGGGERRDITVNLVDVPITTAAKAIIGDVLRENYSVDGNVQGTITLQTPQPQSKAELLENLQVALKANGATIVEQSGVYRILPETAASQIPKGIRLSGAPSGQLIGAENEIIPLRYVAASELIDVLGRIVTPESIAGVDLSRNAIIVSGTPQELAAVRDAISIFDVDWLAGMSFAIHPLQNSEPVAIANELETIFSNKNGPLKGLVRFVPNIRLRSVLVITSQQKYLRDASFLIAKLDKLAVRNERRVHVYSVQNRSAGELAKLLQSVMRSASGTPVVVDQPVAPRQVAQRGQSDSTTPDDDDFSNEPQLIPTPSAPSGDRDDTDSIRIVADDANNSLLIVSTDPEYAEILDILTRIDAIPNQVLLEAVIAEVSLNDELKFGVRWFIGSSDNNVTFSDVATGAIVSSFPGFSYSLATSAADVVINALNSVTDVNVISSPSLVVLDNRTATLQVGDQVPVATQSTVQTTDLDAPIVNQIELKDTGVIMSITPRVNDSGRVILDVDQEVSTAAVTTSSGIDSPTISQRKLSTTVAVNNGETLTLGGLIQERSSKSETKVPLLGDLPGIGVAFRDRDDEVERTELVIFIRPRVIRNFAEAKAVTDEFRAQLSVPDRIEGLDEPDKLLRTIKRVVE